MVSFLLQTGYIRKVNSLLYTDPLVNPCTCSQSKLTKVIGWRSQTQMKSPMNHYIFLLSSEEIVMQLQQATRFFWKMSNWFHFEKQKVIKTFSWYLYLNTLNYLKWDIPVLIWKTNICFSYFLNQVIVQNFQKINSYVNYLCERKPIEKPLRIRLWESHFSLVIYESL